MNAVAIVCTSLDDADRAEALAEAAIRKRLAACVQIHAAGRSFYRWEGSLHKDREVYLCIKTAPALRARLVQWLEREHPYEVPEIVWWQGEATAPYHAWVQAQVRAEGGGD